MTSTIISLALALAAGATGQAPAVCTNPNHHHGAAAATAGFGPHGGGGRIVTPGPGYGWGFPNGNPDGYGWWDHGNALPLDANRTPEYFFPRYFSMSANQMFLQSYYNPYLTRGQRYIAFVNCGGQHPAGGPPSGSAMTPVHPYQDTLSAGPRVSLPTFSGRSEAPIMPPGSSGLTP